MNMTRFGGIFTISSNLPQASHIAQQVVGEDGTLTAKDNQLAVSGRFDSQLRHALDDAGIRFDYQA